MKSLAELLFNSSLSLPADSYIFDLIPIVGSDNLATIASNDALRLIDRSLQVFDGTSHHGVTCLENFEAGVGCLVTAGKDATCRVWDPRTGLKSLQVGKGPNAPYLALASAGNHLAVGTELSNSQAIVAAWDCRSPKEPFVQYVESHNDDVTELCFHPLDSSSLLSGSTDGLINVFNTTVTDEDEALVQITNHGSSIHHAGFLSPTEFYALSHDETFSIYRLDAGNDETEIVLPKVFGDLRTRLSCDYVVDVINLGDGIAIMGAGSYSEQHLDLIPLRLKSEWVFDAEHTIRLPGAHGDEIVRSMCFVTAKQTAFTGGEDGQVKAWRLPADDSVADVSMAGEPEASKKRKKHDSTGSKTGRFKPY